MNQNVTQGFTLTWLFRGQGEWGIQFTSGHFDTMEEAKQVMSLAPFAQLLWVDASLMLDLSAGYKMIPVENDTFIAGPLVKESDGIRESLFQTTDVLFCRPEYASFELISCKATRLGLQGDDVVSTVVPEEKNAGFSLIKPPYRVFLVCLFILTVILLTGCSTTKEEMLPTGEHTMLELWNGADGEGGTARQSTAARDALRRPLTDDEHRKGTQDDRSYSRTQESEISQQFSRLPNPDMVMYLYPHLAGGNTPVPGYSTVFPFYSQTQYAMPGERTEAL